MSGTVLGDSHVPEYNSQKNIMLRYKKKKDKKTMYLVCIFCS